MSYLKGGINDIEVYSCGTFAENGDYASYNAIEAMKNYDIDLTYHRSTNIIDSNILSMDIVLCATLSHKISVLHMYPELKGKVYTMKEYVGFLDENKEYDIKDPWGYSLNTFIECAAEIKVCIDKTIDKIVERSM